MANLGNSVVNGSLQADEIKIVGEAGQTALFVSGNTTISGDLEIKGDLTYVGTKDIRVEDKVIEIAYNPDGETTPAQADGAGIVIGNEANPVASITYRNTDDKIVFSKPVAGTVETASVAVSAETADKVKHLLKFGNGISGSVRQYDGSQEVVIGIDTGGVSMDSAKHADSASKVDNALTITGDGLAAAVVFDGSEAKTATLDLSAYNKVSKFNSYTASQQTINTNILASASAAQTAADNAAAAVTNLSSSVASTYETVQNFNSYTSSVSSALSASSAEIAAIQEQVGDGGSIDDRIASAIQGLDVASTGSAGYHIQSISEVDGKISAVVAANDDYSIVKQDTAEVNASATYYLTKNGAQVGAKINIPKDMVVSSGEVKVCKVANQPVAGYKVGDKYIDLVLANSENHIYILVSDLVDKFDGKNIVLSADYVEASAAAKPVVGDSVDVAIGKLTKSYSTVSTEVSGLVAKSGSWDSAKNLVNASASLWSAAEKNAKDAAASSLTNYSSSQATVNANILASASAARTAANKASSDLASYTASQATVNTNILASASAAQTAADGAQSAAEAAQTTATAASASAAANATKIASLTSATSSYMKTDASNANIGDAGIKFASGAVLKYDTTEQAFEFVFE